MVSGLVPELVLGTVRGWMKSIATALMPYVELRTLFSFCIMIAYVTGMHMSGRMGGVCVSKRACASACCAAGVLTNPGSRSCK